MNPIVVVVSVDWEGMSLLPNNLDAMREFRNNHPDVPMQQFLNAAYYLQEDESPKKITQKINSVLIPEDEHGLHLHAWSSLQQQAGIDIRHSPTFFHPESLAEYGVLDAGYGVPLEAFAVDELTCMLEESVRLLTRYGFKSPSSFRAGGWQAGPNVFTALSSCGFTLDCSCANTEITKRTPSDSLRNMLLDLWPSSNALSQPYQITTPKGALWELPNNGALADFISADEMMAIFTELLAHRNNSSSAPVYFSIGFHQESAFAYLDRIDQVVRNIKEIATDENIPLIFTADPIKSILAIN